MFGIGVVLLFLVFYLVLGYFLCRFYCFVCDVCEMVWVVFWNFVSFIIFIKYVFISYMVVEVVGCLRSKIFLNLVLN